MINTATFVLDGFAYNANKSENPDPKGEREENLMICAPILLEQFYRDGHPREMKPVERMMRALPDIAKFYGLDRQEILEAWTRDYGIFHMLKS